MALAPAARGLDMIAPGLGVWVVDVLIQATKVPFSKLGNMLGKLMRSLIFEGKTWATFESLREKDKQLHNALRKLLKEMLRGDLTRGIGKPEPLKHNLSGIWSRRISQRDRLIYKFGSGHIYILAIGGHYNKH